ncbi:MAG: hypothetical protein R3315_10595 [Woeseiaceae bacterium]|nr:hypothetical protein [Woeseiaceae bacterium]
MADQFSGIGNVGPTYPVKPVERPGKDRPSGERKKKPPSRPETEDDDGSKKREDRDRPRDGQIDEYI